MKLFRGGNSLLCLTLAWTLMASAPACLAKQSTNLSKRARKVEKKLVHYAAGSHLHLVMRDGSDRFGTLGKLSATSFSFTDEDNNAVETIHYEDVTSAKKGSAAIGEGSVRHHRFHLPCL